MIQMYSGMIVLEGGLAFQDFIWQAHTKMSENFFSSVKHPDCYWMVLG